ncbi:MAG: acireductone synthase [Gammaproteobacteria bacterium]|nr:MAG: acireductone synthase [Gammaproteobacteria bacterium]
MPAVAAVLVDIEGTTSSITFVHDVLFPYARAELPGFVRAHRDAPEVRAELEATAAQTNLDPADTEAIIATLLGWIDADEKATPLKSLQGMIWETGYREGAFRAHLYPDSATALAAWHDAGLPLYVYSSGSIYAQQLFFGHSEAGDLRHLFSGFFDTTSGHKREAASYANIARSLELPPEQILFLSDVPEELDAARAAGLGTVWVIREEEGRYRLAASADSPHQVVARLTDLSLEPLH